MGQLVHEVMFLRVVIRRTWAAWGAVQKGCRRPSKIRGRGDERQVEDETARGEVHVIWCRSGAGFGVAVGSGG